MTSSLLHASFFPIAVSSRVGGRQPAPTRASVPSARAFSVARSASLRPAARNARPLVRCALPEGASAEEAQLVPAKPACRLPPGPARPLEGFKVQNVNLIF